MCVNRSRAKEEQCLSAISAGTTSAFSAGTTRGFSAAPTSGFSATTTSRFSAGTITAMTLYVELTLSPSN